jgi:site-specific recombinase XerD
MNLSHFGFIRAVVQGIDAGEAASRYLLAEMDSRSARTTFDALMRRIACTHADLVDLIQNALSSAGQASRLDLEEFAQQFPMDMYSERELIKLYKERLPADAAPDAGKALAAVARLQTELAYYPQPSDPISNWFPPSLCKAISQQGVISLEDCCNLIRLRGKRWYTKCRRLGRVRAARLERWIVDNQEYLGFSGHAIVSTLGASCSIRVTALVPLDQLFLPSHLDGHDGVFRNFESINALGASNDLQAVEAWFGSLANVSQHTIKAYRQEVERFVLWSVLEKGKPISSLDALDAQSYREFLRSLPAHWIQSTRCNRSSTSWKPFRSQLNRTSILRSLAAVSSLFERLVATGYLRVNAMAGIARQAGGAGRGLENHKFFSAFEAKAILHGLDDLDAQSRRLRAIVMLLIGTGMRISEPVTLTWAAVERVRLHREVVDRVVIRIQGKGGKERVVPLRDEIVDALEAHYQDRIVAIGRGDLPASLGEIPKEASPLLSALEKPPSGARLAHPNGGLGSAGIHHQLKRYFMDLERHSGAAFNASIQKASAHWLRHTFAHQVLDASGGDLPVTQSLLGHSSIQTTGLYVKADMSARITAIENMGIFLKESS